MGQLHIIIKYLTPMIELWRPIYQRSARCYWMSKQVAYMVHLHDKIGSSYPVLGYSRSLKKNIVLYIRLVITIHHNTCQFYGEQYCYIHEKMSNHYCL